MEQRLKWVFPFFTIFVNMWCVYCYSIIWSLNACTHSSNTSDPLTEINYFHNDKFIVPRRSFYKSNYIPSIEVYKSNYIPCIEVHNSVRWSLVKLKKSKNKFFIQLAAPRFCEVYLVIRTTCIPQKIYLHNKHDYYDYHRCRNIIKVQNSS